ncbi:MAG: hypothetical protein IT174_11350 [Acidobacteria bacterium]|nr:hypothetical protein [Acidobacteriota bacterium]
MENLIYYIALVLTIVTTGFGAFLILVSVFKIVLGRMRSILDKNFALNSAHLANGTLNLLVGGGLFFWLDRNGFSSYSTVGILIGFSLLEGFVRRYYSKRLEKL